MRRGMRVKQYFFTYICLILLISISYSTIAIKEEFLLNKSNNETYTHKDTDDLFVMYDLLIIVPDKFSSLLDSFVEHKNNLGIKTRVVTIEEVYSQMFWEGKDDAEKLKYFIKQAIEEWQISYVLLIGGRKDQSKEETWWIPVRYTNLIREYKGHEAYSEGDFLTDLYFADIYDQDGNFSSWDDDNDGIFGEWPLDEIAQDILDLYPDIAVGRLPCRNAQEVKTIINKIIRYETTD